jgi:hypothetical protein
MGGNEGYDMIDKGKYTLPEPDDGAGPFFENLQLPGRSFSGIIRSGPEHFLKSSQTLPYFFCNLQLMSHSFLKMFNSVIKLFPESSVDESLFFEILIS